jgi:hypothetical protein
MNYYVFYCFDESTVKYLNGTHIMYVENPPKGASIGYLY